MYIMVAGARDRYLIKGSEPWISWFAYLSLCGVFIDICRLMAFPSNGEVSIRTYLNRLIKGWVGHGDGWGPQFGIGVAGDLTFRIWSLLWREWRPRVGVCSFPFLFICERNYSPSSQTIFYFSSMRKWKRKRKTWMHLCSFFGRYIFISLPFFPKRKVCLSLWLKFWFWNISLPGLVGLLRLMGLKALLSLIPVSLSFSLSLSQKIRHMMMIWTIY